jgi:hypothetical protein
MIVLGAATDTTKPVGAPAQVVKVSGKLSVAGKQTGTTGGKIQITGENIQLASATLDASGRAGGGKVLIGGDTGGGKLSAAAKAIMVAALESTPVPTASNVSIDSASVIDVSANDVGDGGKAIVWSNLATNFAGSILARGGALSGNGGFVETSSHGNLAFSGNVDVAAPKGQSGTLLLDPRNVTIGTTGPWVVTPAAIQNALATGYVIVSTDAAGTDAGDITVAQNVSWSTSYTLQLSAHRNITINDGVTISNTHAGSGNPPILLLLVTDRSGTGVGTVNFIGSGKVDFSQSSHGVFILYNPPLASSHVLTSPSSPGLYARMRTGDLSDLNGIVPDINSNPQTPLPPNTTRFTGGPVTSPSSALPTSIPVASIERQAIASQGAQPTPWTAINLVEQQSLAERLRKQDQNDKIVADQLFLVRATYQAQLVEISAEEGLIISTVIAGLAVTGGGSIGTVLGSGVSVQSVNGVITTVLAEKLSVKLLEAGLSKIIENHGIIPSVDGAPLYIRVLDKALPFPTNILIRYYKLGH